MEQFLSFFELNSILANAVVLFWLVEFYFGYNTYTQNVPRIRLVNNKLIQ